MKARLLAFVLASTFAAPAFAEPRKLSLNDVLRIVLSSHPRLAAARSRADADSALASSAHARMLPAVHVSDEYQYYDSPFDISFNGAAFRARDQTTNTFVAGATQPLLGLLRQSEEYRAQAKSADAAGMGVKIAEANLREAVEVDYLRMFEAKALVDIAHASETELAEQVNVTGARVKAGALTNADLLRVEVAESNARQQGIAARAQVTRARASILTAIGLLPNDANVEFEEPAELLGVEQPRAITVDQAIASRAEVAQAELSADAARHEARARGYGLLPDVALEGAYLRVDGQVFAPKNSGYVGLKADWAIWEWGASASARRAAESRAAAARADVETQRREVAVELAARDAELDAAASAVAVAEQTIASAQEAYRVTEVQVRTGAATVTDLLDAQAALTQARLNLARARYEHAIAEVERKRAAGVTAP